MLWLLALHQWSVEKLTMGGGTPRNNSGGITGTTASGTELNRQQLRLQRLKVMLLMLSLVLLSLVHLRQLVLSPLLHLMHLVLLSLGHPLLHLAPMPPRSATVRQMLLGLLPHLRHLLLIPLLHLRHLMTRLPLLRLLLHLTVPSLLCLCHLGLNRSSCEALFPASKPSLTPAATWSALPMTHARP